MVLKAASPISAHPVGSALGPQWRASWQGKEIIWQDKKTEGNLGVRFAHDDNQELTRVMGELLNPFWGSTPKDLSVDSNSQRFHHLLILLLICKISGDSPLVNHIRYYHLIVHLTHSRNFYGYCVKRQIRKHKIEVHTPHSNFWNFWLCRLGQFLFLFLF